MDLATLTRTSERPSVAAAGKILPDLVKSALFSKAGKKRPKKSKAGKIGPLFQKAGKKAGKIRPLDFFGTLFCDFCSEIIEKTTLVSLIPVFKTSKLCGSLRSPRLIFFLVPFSSILLKFCLEVLAQFQVVFGLPVPRPSRVTRLLSHSPFSRSGRFLPDCVACPCGQFVL